MQGFSTLLTSLTHHSSHLYFFKSWLICFFKKYIFFNFIFGLCWVYVALLGLSLVGARGGYSVAVLGLLIVVNNLSCCKAQALGMQISIAVACGCSDFSSCGAQQLLPAGLMQLRFVGPRAPFQ